MKNTKLILFLYLPFLLGSCKNNAESPKTEDAQTKMESTDHPATSSEQLMKSVNDIRANADALRETTSLSQEELKLWLPDELDGMRRTGYKSGAMMIGGISSIEGEYASADNIRKLKVELMDGAGEMGASVAIAAQTTLAMDYEEESETKSRRTVTKNGMRAVEEYQKKSGKTIVETLYGNRLYLKVTGEKMEPDDVWAAMEALHIEKLL